MDEEAPPSYAKAVNFPPSGKLPPPYTEVPLPGHCIPSVSLGIRVEFEGPPAPPTDVMKNILRDLKMRLRVGYEIPIVDDPNLAQAALRQARRQGTTVVVFLWHPVYEGRRGDLQLPCGSEAFL